MAFTPFRTRQEKVLALKIIAFMLFLPVRLRRKLNHLSDLLDAPPRESPEFTPESVQRCCENVFALAKPIVRTDCLGRGLTLCYFLRKANLDVRLVFGIGEVNGQTAGHCWLERDGQPWLEKSDPRPIFRPMYSIPA